MSRPSPSPPASPNLPKAQKPLGFVGILLRLPRFISLRCPHCDRFPLRQSLTQFHDTCGQCGFRFIVEDGDFWGGVVFGYLFAGILGILLGGALTLGGWFNGDTNIYIAASTAGGSILVTYPWAKSAWIHLLYLTRGQYADYAPPDKKNSAAR